MAFFQKKEDVSIYPLEALQTFGGLLDQDEREASIWNILKRISDCFCARCVYLYAFSYRQAVFVAKSDEFFAEDSLLRKEAACCTPEGIFLPSFEDAQVITLETRTGVSVKVLGFFVLIKASAHSSGRMLQEVCEAGLMILRSGLSPHTSDTSLARARIPEYETGYLFRIRLTKEDCAEDVRYHARSALSDIGYEAYKDMETDLLVYRDCCDEQDAVACLADFHRILDRLAVTYAITGVGKRKDVSMEKCKKISDFSFVFYDKDTDKLLSDGDVYAIIRLMEGSGEKEPRREYVKPDSEACILEDAETFEVMVPEQDIGCNLYYEEAQKPKEGGEMLVVSENPFGTLAEGNVSELVEEDGNNASEKEVLKTKEAPSEDPYEDICDGVAEDEDGEEYSTSECEF